MRESIRLLPDSAQSLGDIQNMPTRSVWGSLANCALISGIKDTFFFENREVKKTCFGRSLDGLGWVWRPSNGLRGLKIGHDIIQRRLLKIGQFGTKLVT